MLKYYKYGFGSVTNEVCYDIKEGRLSGEEAIKLWNNTMTATSVSSVSTLTSHQHVAEGEIPMTTL